MDKKTVTLHGQRFVRAIMADRLRQAGFISKNGDDIHWYRIVNGQVVHAVYFYTRHTDTPIFINIGYACHPLFLVPEFPKELYLYAMTAGFEVFHPGRPLMKANTPTRFIFDEYTWVSCPDDELAGADLLEDVLAILKKAQTQEECYQIHKNLYLNMSHNPLEQRLARISTEFMDEIVYWNDLELYPYCAYRINSWLEQLEKHQSIRKLWKFEQAEMEKLKRLKRAIIDEDRESHLLYLKEQENKTLKLLKKAGITIYHHRDKGTDSIGNGLREP